MSRLIALILALSISPALAEEPNLSSAKNGSPGAATRLILAQRAYQAALTSGDTITLLAAIRLARSASPRAPTGWERTTPGEAPADEPSVGDGPPDPAGARAIAIAQGLAGEDPDLQDLVYDLDAQLPRGRLETAIVASAMLGAGQTDRWRLPLFGEVHAEVALIGNGAAPLGLVVTDEGGAIVCAVPPSLNPGLCRFTPARNAFFEVEIRNPGTVDVSYRLIGN